MEETSQQRPLFPLDPVPIHSVHLHSSLFPRFLVPSKHMTLMRQHRTLLLHPLSPRFMMVDPQRLQPGFLMTPNLMMQMLPFP